MELCQSILVGVALGLSVQPHAQGDGSRLIGEKLPHIEIVFQRGGDLVEALTGAGDPFSAHRVTVKECPYFPRRSGIGQCIAVGTSLRYGLAVLQGAEDLIGHIPVGVLSGGVFQGYMDDGGVSRLYLENHVVYVRGMEGTDHFASVKGDVPAVISVKGLRLCAQGEHSPQEQSDEQQGKCFFHEGFLLILICD